LQENFEIKFSLSQTEWLPAIRATCFPCDQSRQQPFLVPALVSAQS
jgi:hypothetical protein